MNIWTNEFSLLTFADYSTEYLFRTTYYDVTKCAMRPKTHDNLEIFRTACLGP